MKIKGRIRRERERVFSLGAGVPAADTSLPSACDNFENSRLPSSLSLISIAEQRLPYENSPMLAGSTCFFFVLPSIVERVSEREGFVVFMLMH